MKIDSQKIIDEVLANIALLEQCVGPHKFTHIEGSVFSKMRCELCGGLVDGIHAIWYQRGLEHGARIAAQNHDKTTS